MKTKAIRVAATKDMPREEWLVLRREGLGGSDASTVMGLNPYSDRLTLFCDKKGLLPEKEDTESMRLGRDLEEYVAKRFCEATGKKVKRSGYMWRHPQYAFLQANIDREVVGEDAILECKTTMNYDRHDYDSGEIPMNYYCQCMHYMAVTGCDRAYLAVLVFGKGFYWFTIERDENEVQSLVESEVEFWQTYVEQNRPPEADGSESSLETIQKLHPYDDGDTTQIMGMDDMVRQYLDLGESVKRLKKQQDEIRAQLCQALGTRSAAVGKDYSFSWKAQSTNRLDTKRLKEEHPDIYDEYLTVTNSRVFRAKKRK